MIVCSFYKKIYLVRLDRKTYQMRAEGIVRMRDTFHGLHFTQHHNFLLGTHNYRTFITLFSVNTKRHLCKFSVFNESSNNKVVKEQLHFYHYKTVSVKKHDVFLIAGVYTSGKFSLFNVLPNQRKVKLLQDASLSLGENSQITNVSVQGSSLVILIAEKDLIVIVQMDGVGVYLQIKNMKQMSLSNYSQILETPIQAGFSESGGFALVQCPKSIYIIRYAQETGSFEEKGEFLLEKIDCNSRWLLQGDQLQLVTSQFKEIVTYQIQRSKISELKRHKFGNNDLVK